ncbi:MAG TPA: hypothetical protein PLY35_10330 [Thermotogota bacterium]|nr:hypothetical protein [Thermotogota bacterium]
MTILEQYNKSKRSIFKNVGTAELPIVDRDSALDNINSNPVTVDITNTLNDYKRQPFNNTGIYNTYVQNRGYIATAATTTSFLLGNGSITDVASSMAGILSSGNPIVGAVLRTGTNLVNKLNIDDKVNEAISSTIPLDFLKNGTGIITQLYFNKILLQNNPPNYRYNVIGEQVPFENSNILNDIPDYNPYGDIVKNTAASFMGGKNKLTISDAESLTNSAINKLTMETLAKTGEKYTQGLAMKFPYTALSNGEPALFSDKINYRTYLPRLYSANFTYLKLLGTDDVFNSFLFTNLYANYSSRNNQSSQSYIAETNTSNPAKKSRLDVISDSIINWIKLNETSLLSSSSYDDIYAMQRIGYNHTTSNTNVSADNFNMLGYNVPSTSRYISDLITSLKYGEDYTDIPGGNVSDRITFKFTVNNKPLIFRATLKSIKDSPSPSWESVEYIGNAQKKYLYKGWERKLSFDFNVIATSKSEMQPMWDKLNILFGCAYPYSYQRGTGIQPPIVKLTIGNLYNDLVGFLSNVSMDIPDEYTWDIDKYVQLPMGANISIEFTIMQENVNDKLITFDDNHFARDVDFDKYEDTSKQVDNVPQSTSAKSSAASTNTGAATSRTTRPERESFTNLPSDSPPPRTDYDNSPYAEYDNNPMFQNSMSF